LSGSGAVMRAPALNRWNLLVTDIGFAIYWLVTALHLLPRTMLFKDYDNPILQAWNWSFAPLDLLASALGLAALGFARAGAPSWRELALLSASLTFCAGFMALSFWIIRGDFDFVWWAPNVYPAAWPLVALPALLANPKQGS
jgi:hypothetical protein